jgi:GntR family transcriptional repressor for pyruvate dehydrogenase complex
MSARAKPASGRTRKAHEVVAAQIRSQIVHGEFVEGQRLPSEEELTAQFGVARTTLREALRVLESQGLLAIKRGRGGGPMVTHPSVEPIAAALAVALQLRGTTLGDLDAARMLIEPQLAGELARRHTDADLAALDAAIELAHEAAERNDGQAFGLAAANVHATLVERSGNITLAMLTTLLSDMLQAYYLLDMDRVEQASMRRAVRAYRKFARLIRARDAEGAVEYWQATMRYTANARSPDQPIRIDAR